MERRIDANFPIILNDQNKSFRLRINDGQILDVVSTAYVLVPLRSGRSLTFRIEVFDSGLLHLNVDTENVILCRNQERFLNDFKGYRALQSKINEFYIVVHNLKKDDATIVSAEPNGDFRKLKPLDHTTLKGINFYADNVKPASLLQIFSARGDIECWSLGADMIFTEAG